MSNSIFKYYEIEYHDFDRTKGWSWSFFTPVAINWISSRGRFDLFETKHDAEVSALEHWSEVRAFMQCAMGDDS